MKRSSEAEAERDESGQETKHEEGGDAVVDGGATAAVGVGGGGKKTARERKRFAEMEMLGRENRELKLRIEATSKEKSEVEAKVTDLERKLLLQNEVIKQYRRRLISAFENDSFPERTSEMMAAPIQRPNPVLAEHKQVMPAKKAKAPVGPAEATSSDTSASDTSNEQSVAS